MKAAYHGLRFVILTLCFTMMAESVRTQTISYTESWNDLSFTRPLSGKWVSEINVGNTLSNSPSQKSPLAHLTQYMGRFWIHHFLNSRYKLSVFAAYFHNYSVPEVGQVYAPEFRIAPQTVYFIRKTGFTLSAISIFEFRFRNVEDQGFKDSYRFRQNIRYLQPLNGTIIRKGVWYGIGGEEIYLNLFNKEGKMLQPDRNRLSLGLGYSLTYDMQLELVYVFEYVFRTIDEVHHGISVGFVFNNFRNNLKKKFRNLMGHPLPDE